MVGPGQDSHDLLMVSAFWPSAGAHGGLVLPQRRGGALINQGADGLGESVGMQKDEGRSRSPE